MPRPDEAFHQIGLRVIAAAETENDLLAVDPQVVHAGCAVSQSPASSWRPSSVAVSDALGAAELVRGPSSAVPEASRRPRFITQSDEHISASSLRMCELTKTVAPVGRELAQRVAQIAARQRIEAARRLIENEHARPVEQRFGEHDALRLAARKLLAPTVALRR